MSKCFAVCPFNAKQQTANNKHTWFLGVWLFHCHKKLHAEMGQLMVFKVGSPEDWGAPPQDFPRCGNFGTEEPVNEPSIIKGKYEFLLDLNY